MKPSKWLQAYADHVQGVLGLQAWCVTLDVVDEPNPDNPHADATTYANIRYLTANLKFRTTVAHRRTLGMRVLVLHEFLHIVTAAKDLVTERLLDQFVPAHEREFATLILSDADEQMVTRLSHALVDVIGEPPAGGE